MPRHTNHTPDRACPRLAMLALVGCAATICGCGSTRHPTSTSAAGGSAVEFAQCMRTHGVPQFPDPTASGKGTKIILGAGINAQSPSFQSAQGACAKLGPGGPARTGAASEGQRLAMLTLAKCLRAHGLPNVPDPTTSPPPPSGGNVIGRGGLFLALGPGINGQSPAFKQAAGACGLKLP